MSERRTRRLYAVMVVLCFAGVALLRRDLVAQAAHQTLRALAQGGSGRAKVLGEILLFCAILAGCWRVIASASRPSRDACVLLLASLAGWAAEAWGTRLGLWTYYTSERPPLWIVPAWPLGALVIDRLAEGRRGLERAYWPCACACLLVCLWFSFPWLGTPSGWLGPALAAAGLAWGARPEEDFPPLAAGLCCVFFADLWGTTNGCWSYYLSDRPGGLWTGIAFGMAFDTAVVMACLRLARRLNRTFA